MQRIPPSSTMLPDRRNCLQHQRPQPQIVDSEDEDEPRNSLAHSFPPLTSPILRGHTLASTRPSTDVIVRQWRTFVSRQACVSNPENILPKYPAGWPQDLTRLRSLPPPRVPSGYMATTASTRARMNITAADKTKANEEAQLQFEDERSEEYVFDGRFQENWNEGMRQAVARKNALINDSVSLPSNSHQIPVEYSTGKRKRRDEGQ